MSTDNLMSGQIDDDARKLLGLPPHNTPSNVCAGDGYFQRSCELLHGKEAFAAACERIQRTTVHLFSENVGGNIHDLVHLVERLYPEIIPGIVHMQSDGNNSILVYRHHRDVFADRKRPRVPTLGGPPL